MRPGSVDDPRQSDAVQAVSLRSTAPGLSNSRQSLRSITSGGKALTGDRLYTERPRSAQCLAANLKDGSITRAKCRANRLL